jgi:sugar phosphate isomerase/epimerase
MIPSPDTTSLVERCAAAFAAEGTAMALEFSPLSPFRTIPDGLELVASAGHGAGLLIDTWHFEFGASTWADLEQIPLDRIAYVQFDDAPEPAGDDLWAETTDRRVMPGDGTFQLERFATTLLDRGWEGLVSVEVLNRDLGLDVAEFARRAHDATARYWR